MQTCYAKWLSICSGYLMLHSLCVEWNCHYFFLFHLSYSCSFVFCLLVLGLPYYMVNKDEYIIPIGLGMTLTSDLWPWKTFQQCPLTWWIFVPSFTQIPLLTRTEISPHAKYVSRKTAWPARRTAWCLRRGFFGGWTEKKHRGGNKATRANNKATDVKIY